MRPSLSLLPLSLVLACGGDDGASNPPSDGGLDGAIADTSTGPDAADAADAAGPFGPVVTGDSILQFHNHATRDGLYTQSAFTKAAAMGMKLDPGFDGTIKGIERAQPLFVDNGPGGQSIVIATTEDNQVTALDATTGKVVWQKTVGASPPASKSGAGCGNVNPIGITGTGVIDPVLRTLFVSVVIGTGGASSIIKTHELHALSIDDGSERAGFPVDLSKATFAGTPFAPVLQNQRGALLSLGGTVYVPFAGHYGDCGDYHGWVVGVPFANPAALGAWATAARAGGIWAPGGLASDGTNIFAATGNTFSAMGWQGGEAILRFQPGPVFSALNADYFVPHDWVALDTGDVDIGGSSPVLIDVQGATPSQLVVALGKNGKVYLLDRQSLGGISTTAKGDGLFNLGVASGEIINAAASVTTASGTWLIFHGYGGAVGVGCKTGSGDLVALKITATSPPTATVEWCANSQGEGEPMITTTDGKSEAIVWVGGSQLLGFDVENGNPVFTGAGAALGGAEKFTTPIAAKGRIYVGNDNKVYAFKP